MTDQNPSLEPLLNPPLPYTTCDLADLLLGLSVPHGGFLPDLHPLADLIPSIAASNPTSPTTTSSASRPTNRPLLALASTVTFAPKSSPREKVKGHYADTCTSTPGSLPRIAVIAGPGETRAALMGGTVGVRLKHRGLVGAVVDGRVRDTADLLELGPEGFDVWAAGKSVLGAGEAGKVVGVGEKVTVRGVEIQEGDLVACDAEGVVVVQWDKVRVVGERLEKWLRGEEEVGRLVSEGGEMGGSVKKGRVTFPKL